MRQLLVASGSCRQTCSQQSDVRSFQLNMVSVPVSMRTRCRRWNAGTAPRLHEDPSSAMECGSEKESKRAPTQETSNKKRFSLTAGITFQLLHGRDVGSAQAGSVRFPCACWLLLHGQSWCLVAFWRCPWVSVWFLFLVGRKWRRPKNRAKLIRYLLDVWYIWLVALKFSLMAKFLVSTMYSQDGGHGSFLLCLHGVANNSELRFRLFVDGMLCNLCAPYSRRHLSCVPPCEDHCLCSLTCWGFGINPRPTRTSSILAREK